MPISGSQLIWTISIALSICSSTGSRLKMQTSPTNSTSTQPTSFSGVSDLDSCKNGQRGACTTYGQNLASACTTQGGTPPQQLGCMRKAQCYEDRGLALPNPTAPSASSCDAMLMAGTGDIVGAGAIGGLFVPIMNFTFQDMHSGDCLQEKGLLSFRENGQVDWDAVVSTSHTVFGDVWHARFNFLDADGVAIGNTMSHDSPTMGVPGNRQHWTFTDHVDSSILHKIAQVREVPSC